jgi:hypothetical protein
MEKGGDAVLLGLEAKNPTASARVLLRLAEVQHGLYAAQPHARRQ